MFSPEGWKRSVAQDQKETTPGNVASPNAGVLSKKGTTCGPSGKGLRTSLQPGSAQWRRAKPEGSQQNTGAGISDCSSATATASRWMGFLCMAPKTLTKGSTLPATPMGFGILSNPELWAHLVEGSVQGIWAFQPRCKRLGPKWEVERQKLLQRALAYSPIAYL